MTDQRTPFPDPDASEPSSDTTPAPVPSPDLPGNAGSSPAGGKPIDPWESARKHPPTVVVEAGRIKKALNAAWTAQRESYPVTANEAFDPEKSTITTRSGRIIPLAMPMADGTLPQDEPEEISVEFSEADPAKSNSEAVDAVPPAPAVSSGLPPVAPKNPKAGETAVMSRDRIPGAPSGLAVLPPVSGPKAGGATREPSGRQAPPTLDDFLVSEEAPAKKMGEAPATQSARSRDAMRLLEERKKAQDAERLRLEAIPATQGWLAILAAAFMPLIAVWQPTTLLASMTNGRIPNLTWFDVLIWPAAVLTLVFSVLDARLKHDVKAWLRCVWPAFPLLLAGAASLHNLDGSDGGAVREAGIKGFQWVEYLLVAPWVFLPALMVAKWRGRMFLALFVAVFFVAVGIMVRTPLVGYYHGDLHPHFAGGWLDNRHLYTLFVGMAACLLSGWLGETLSTRKMDATSAVLMLAPAAVFLLPAFSGWLLLGALIGLGACWSGTVRYGALLLIPLAAWLFWIGPTAVGSANLSRAIEGLFSRTTPELAARHRDILVDSVQPWREGDQESRHRPLPSPRMLRWSAELNLFQAHPWTGAGLGQIQRSIDSYYGILPRTRAATDQPGEFDRRVNEPFTFGWYPQAAAETGLLGLGGVLVLLGGMFGRVSSMAMRRPALAAGLLGALLVVAWGGLWTLPLARGVGALLAFVLALSGLAEREEENVLV